MSEDYALIPIYGAVDGVKGVVVNHAKVLHEDVELVSGYRWHLSRGYAAAFTRRNAGKRVQVSMHRLIFNPGEGIQTDHINRDRLDNRRSNLRAATASENSCNRGIGDQASGFHGVVIRKGKFQGQIKSGRRTLYLAIRPAGREAALDYDWAARILRGEFATLNFPEVTDYVPEGMDASWLTRESIPLGRHRRKGNQTGFHGVQPHGSKFRADSQYQGIRKFLGVYPTAEDAARRVDQYEKENYGDRAILNFPDESKEAM